MVSLDAGPGALSSCCARRSDCRSRVLPLPRASHTPHTKVGEMSRALVLNATYEPLCVVPTRRALLLVIQAKAELLAATGRVFHSARVTLDEPSVVRLSYFVRVPHQAHVALNRRAIFARDGHRCQYCGAQAENIDHIRAEVQRRPPRMGQRGGGVPALQRPQAGPLARGNRHEVAPSAGHPAGPSLGTGRARRRPPGLGALPRLPRAGGAADRSAGRRGCTVGVMRWQVQRAGGKVSELHQNSVGSLTGLSRAAVSRCRLAVVQRAANSGLVLGSAQDDGTVDGPACEAAGVEVVRRRSGGGAVLVEPGSVIWVDLVLGATDPLWSADVGRSAWWVGEAWAKALRGAGLGPLDVWKGPMVRGAWSSLVCFAGLGPGEVVDGARRKVVGISQRRTRHGALFQCACLLHWQPGRLLELLVLPEGQRRAASGELAHAAIGVGAERAEVVTQAFLSALPA